MPALTKDELLKTIKKEMESCEIEAQMRLDIQRTPEYQKLDADIEATEFTISQLLTEIHSMRDQQTAMLSVVKDSRPNVEEAKRMLIDIMEIEGVEGYNEDWITATGKWSEKRSVDGRRLLDILGGDIEEFISLVKPTQKAIKDYAAEHEEIKKPLLQCIRLEGRELVGVDIQLPDAK